MRITFSTTAIIIIGINIIIARRDKDDSCEADKQSCKLAPSNRDPESEIGDYTHDKRVCLKDHRVDGDLQAF